MSSEVKGTEVCRSEGGDVLVFCFSEGGAKELQSPGFGNKTRHGKHFRGIVTLPDARFPNCEIRLN